MRRLVALLVVLLLVVVACSSDSDDTSPETTAPPAELTADAILADAAVAMAAVDSVLFELERTGAGVYIDTGDTIAFNTADGRFAAPGSAEAVVQVEIGGFTAEIGAVAIDGDIWLTNPVSGTWETAPEDLTFNPATLFDPVIGWRALLEEGLTDIELVDTTDGRHRITGVAEAERVDVLTGGLVEEEAPIVLLIDADTALLDEVTFDVAVDEGTANWEVLLFEYGTEVVVTVPPLDG
ncbi:MAG: LppX_LprAFG lipoprotein [Actinomycetota bacterium]